MLWLLVLTYACETGTVPGDSATAPTVVNSAQASLTERVNGRDFPAAFQAWYGIDMPEYPQDTEEQRLRAAAKHDLLWEEPLSQLGEGVDLVLGLKWAGAYDGLATEFEEQSLEKARKNRASLLALNPNMIFLFEIRWRDAPSSFLPEDSPFWKRLDNGEVEKGWLGGWVPFYLLDYDNKAFQDNVARQAKIALESAVYDGVMLDWSGHLPIVKKVREAIGKDGLILVNIHDDIADGEKYKDYINGAFMELNPEDESTRNAKVSQNRNLRQWENIQKALLWFEENLQSPRINCLEVWGDRKDLARMRATTTLGLTHSDGYVLYGDPNPLATPDHLHDWYSFWDVPLRKPKGKMTQLRNGAFQRAFQGGSVVYNPFQNGAVRIRFREERTRASNGQKGKVFSIADRDGDIFY